MDTAGEITRQAPVPFGPAYDIASGAGAGAPLWFTLPSFDRIGRITTTGEITTFPLPGAPSIAGPQGEPGPAGTSRIGVVAFQVKPSQPRSGKRLWVRFALTGRAKVTLAVTPLSRGKRKATKVASRTVGAGIRTIAWNGRLHGKRAKPGRYRLTVTIAAGGAGASSWLTVKLAG
jgi:hypothetical protein